MTESELSVFSVAPDEVGIRLDRFLTVHTELTRSAAAKRIETGAVTVNGKTVSKNYLVRTGDGIEVEIPEPEECDALPQDIPLDVVYEDDAVIVINKPCGMVVHPAVGNPDGTLVNALLWHCGDRLSGVGGVKRPGIVHRIDKDTSGLLVVAKTDAAHFALSSGLKEHRIRRVYFAIAVGNFKEDAGTVDAPIGRHPTDRKKMAVIRDATHTARDAVTHWSVLARGASDGISYTLLRCELETGRTHQIRVHLASLGHPLLGDELYGGNRTGFAERHKNLLHGQCLHAGILSFTHPTAKKEVTFSAPLPIDFERTITLIFGAETAKSLNQSIEKG